MNHVFAILVLCSLCLPAWGADVPAAPRAADANATVQAKTEAEKKESNPITLLKNKVIGSSSMTTNATTATPINTYKPTGQLIYNTDIINSLKQNK